MKQIGRNDPCPCGSGKKYKICCMDKDQQVKQIRRKNDIKPDLKISPPDMSLVDDMSTNESEDQNIFDEFWDKYEIADFNEKVSMIEEAYNNPSLMDADFVYEILNELNKSATTKLERETYTKMVKRLKENHSKIYEKEAGYLLDHCVGNATIDKQMSELKPLFLEYASFAYKTIDIFNLRVDQLAYHGHLELLKEGYRIGWRKVENSGDIMPWGIDEFAVRGSDFELFSYLQNASNPRADDELLINRIEYYVDLDKKHFNKYFSSITRPDAPTWRYEDFDLNPKNLKKNELSDYAHNISNLCNEFLDFMHIEGEKAYPKAELMRTEITNYIIKRLHGDFEQHSKSRKRKPYNSIIVNVLCPDRSTLDQYLAQLMDLLSYRLYRALALYESIPYWLNFLELNRLIDHFSHNEVYNSISFLYEDVERLIMQQDFYDEFAINELRAAWYS